MKIKGNSPQTKLTVYGTVQVQESRSGATDAKKVMPASSGVDWVDFSGYGQMFADAQRALAFIPDIRMPLVNQIQSDLQDGSYVYDNIKSAEGMLKESFENQAALMYLM